MITSSLVNQSPVKDSSHPVFSDFNHVAHSVENARFAVGLREENSEAVLERILPLAKNVTGQKKERVIRKAVKDNSVCMRPDCVARRENLEALGRENNGIKDYLKEVEGKLAASRNRAALTEKSIDLAEEKSENYNIKIDEAQAMILDVKQVVDKGEAKLNGLMKQLSSLQSDIEMFKKQCEDYRKQTKHILDMENGPGLVFGSTDYSKKFIVDDVAEVSKLDFTHDTERSDDDEILYEADDDDDD
jgi:chromosome segregation ATPase